MFPLVKSLGRFHDQASMYTLQSYKYYLKAVVLQHNYILITQLVSNVMHLLANTCH